MPETLWQLQQVTMAGSPRPRLAEVNLDVPAGVTAVLGASGSGKTSLLNLLVGFETPDRGRVRAIRSASGDRLPLCWVPPDDGLWPHVTAIEHPTRVMPRTTPDTSAAAMTLLAKFGLREHAHARPATLSTGQRSRLAVARALAAAPAVLVMDEPLSHVDRATARACWQVMREHLAATGASLVFATHEPEVVLREAAQAICLKDGRVLSAAPVRELYEQPATRELAEFLGEVNWLEAEEAALWLPAEAGPAQALRPERARLVPDDASPVRLCHLHSAGPLHEAELEHEPTARRRRWLYGGAGNGLHVGQRVALRLMLLPLMILVGAGCGDSSDPVLAVQRVAAWSVPAVDQRLPAPRSVSIGPDNQVIVLDNAGRVLVFDAAGQLIRQWDMPTNEHGNPEGICWLKDGRVAVADTHYHRVLFFDDTGQVLGQLGRFSERGEPGCFYCPVSIVQDDREHLYVSEYGGYDRVQKFTREGELVDSFGEPGTGPGQFQRAAGMAWHEGRIYIADAANGRVQVFEDDGRFVEILGERAGGARRFEFPYDVAMAPDETLFVIEWGAGRVSRLRLDGKLLGRFGEPGVALGQFRTPWGIAVDSQMRVWIADTHNRRIVELAL